jgi:LacI family transcriptional regulator
MPAPAPVIRILFPSAGNGRNHGFLRGVSDALRERYRWTLDFVTPDTPEVYLRDHGRRACDGLIAMPTSAFRGGFLASLGLPVVTILIADGDLPAILPDEATIGRLAARHLGQVGWSPRAAGEHLTPWWQDRLAGWHAQAPQAPADLVPGDDNRALDWLRALPPRTAIFCANDALAIRLAMLAPTAGRMVGRDLRLLGVDDAIDCHFVTPALSSIALPLQEIGHRAVRTMARLLQGTPVPARQLVAPLGLIVRGSSHPLATAEPWLQDLAEQLHMAIAAGQRPQLQRLLPSLGVSPSTVDRAWRAAVGCSIMEWIQDYRRELARARLAAGDRTVDEVARSVGLGSERSLRRLLTGPG